MSDVAALAAATPTSRDRYVDFLRVASLMGVILGHFVMAVVMMDPAAGTFSFTNILELAPWTRWGTLLLQVMPVFFVVGGFAHAVSLRSLRSKGGGYADFVQARISRLVRPALVFIGVWLVVGIAATALVPDNPATDPALQIAGQLLWFIGIYLIAAAFAPLLLRAHERYGIGALAALAAGIVAVDVLRLGVGIDGVKWVNFAFVWLAIHQLGFFYADGIHERVGARRLGAWMLGVGATAIAVLATVGPYGIAMVSYNGEKLSNLTPPTVVLFAFAVAQAGALLLVRRPVSAWLGKARPWKAVIVGGSVAMTAFLWHFTALILVYLSLWVAGVSLTAGPTEAAFWWLKLALLGPFLVLVAVLVVVFRRFDRPPARPTVVGPSRARASLAAAGVALAIVGMIGFASVGFRGILELYTVTVVGVPVSAALSAGLVAVSAAMTALSVRRR